MEQLRSLYEKLHPLERKILPFLDKASTLSELMDKSGLSDAEAMRALQWMSNKKIVSLSEDIKEIIALDVNGVLYLKNGLPEKRFLMALSQETNLEKVRQKANLDKNEISICLGILKKKAAIDISKDEKGSIIVTILPNGKNLLEKETLEEKFIASLKEQRDLSTLADEERFAMEELRKRKDIIKVELKKIKFIEVTVLGKKLMRIKPSYVDAINRLTPQLLREGAWKKKKFRAFDVVINVPRIYGGKRHFVNQAIDYVKKIWLEMGFEEMEGNLIQTSFWDLDALFVPQDHPARAMQDTFYLAKPDYGKLPKLAETIKNVHENGWTTGSKGWQEPWSEEKAKELLLRTHTTVLSAQTLAKLDIKDLPKKYFTVGKVFRNEALDWKHLFEFYQVEGIVADKNANFKHLLGYLKEFFRKMGYSDVRIRPAHFPYTEPSCEIEVLHQEKNEWIELGGAGIFRPEVTKPLLGEEVPVLAWGFGLGRIICPYYNITDLRDQYKNDFRQLREIRFWMK